MSSNAEDIDWRSACPVASALDAIGDKWSLLILRDLFSHGTRTYSEFLTAPEHISTNILAARLKLLGSLGLIERADPEGAARNNAFRLTESGDALRPVLAELARWSQTHLKGYHAGIVDVV